MRSLAARRQALRTGGSSLTLRGRLGGAQSNQADNHTNHGRETLIVSAMNRPTELWSQSLEIEIADWRDERTASAERTIFRTKPLSVGEEHRHKHLANFGLVPLTEVSIESPEHRDIVQLAALLILEDSVQSADTTTELLGVFPVSVMHSDKTIPKSMRINLQQDSKRIYSALGYLVISMV
ncbi:hypothetical protein BDV09DRAFT_112277 [Aspergillus tetrazonus]